MDLSLKRPVPSWLLPMLIPTSALALDTTVRSMDGGGRFWVTLFAVQILATLGYAASSLAQWQGWPDGTLGVRLNIVQGMLTAILAGNIGFYGGYYYFNLAEVVCFITAAVAAWGGDKFLSPLLSRITGRMGEHRL